MAACQARPTPGARGSLFYSNLQVFVHASERLCLGHAAAAQSRGASHARLPAVQPGSAQSRARMLRLPGLPETFLGSAAGHAAYTPRPPPVRGHFRAGPARPHTPSLSFTHMRHTHRHLGPQHLRHLIGCAELHLPAEEAEHRFSRRSTDLFFSEEIEELARQMCTGARRSREATLQQRRDSGTGGSAVATAAQRRQREQQPPGLTTQAST